MYNYIGGGGETLIKEAGINFVSGPSVLFYLLLLQTGILPADHILLQLIHRIGISTTHITTPLIPLRMTYRGGTVK